MNASEKGLTNMNQSHLRHARVGKFHVKSCILEGVRVKGRIEEPMDYDFVMAR